ncbi:MAG TPA: DNA polymerase IV, partial [Elusimicrobiota bacterium]|nr:DNA polymerase IV [Elusimicrobiota bacterium]
MNAYFAAVEQKGNPLIRGKPVVVVGDLSRRSVILTASY